MSEFCTDVRRHIAKDCRDSIFEVSQLGNSVKLYMLAPCSSSKLETSSCRKVLPWLFVFLPVWAKEEVLHRPVSLCWGGPANILNVSNIQKLWISKLWIFSRVQSNASVTLFQVADAGFFASKLKTLEDPKVGKHLVTTEAVSRPEQGSMENFSGSNRIAGLHQIER